VNQKTDDPTFAFDSGATLDRELLLQTHLDRQHAVSSALDRRLRRLAFDLHDGALQELSALAAELASARRKIVPVVDEEYRERVEGRFDDLQARLEGLDHSLRTLLDTVHHGGGERFEALDTRIAREVASLRDDSGIEAELEINGSFTDLTESRRIAIFHIVREALANTRDHSEAQHVRVRVVEREGRVDVCVEDDGRGFDLDAAVRQASSDRRFGLKGMMERVALLGGDLVVNTGPGQGTCVSFVLDAWDPSGETLQIPSDLAL
jgi:two-component system sensor histidine kinase UhpB